MLSPGEHWLLLSTTNIGHQPVVNATGHQTGVFTSTWWFMMMRLIPNPRYMNIGIQIQKHFSPSPSNTLLLDARRAYTHWWRHSTIFGSHLEFGYNICTCRIYCDSLHNNRLSCHRWCQHLDAVKIRRWQDLRSHTLGGRIEDMTDGCPVCGNRPLCSRWLLI